MLAKERGEVTLVGAIHPGSDLAEGRVGLDQQPLRVRYPAGDHVLVRRAPGVRWRIENETFNMLKNQGDHFENNFGHGYQHLSVVFAQLMMLAFLVDQVQQLYCPLFQSAWARWGSKRLLWEKMRALFFGYALASMQQLFEALFYGLKKSASALAIDSA